MPAMTSVVVVCARCTGTVEIPVDVRKVDRHEIDTDAPASAVFAISSRRVEHTCQGDTLDLDPAELGSVEVV